jgi:2-keto-4-pentenoate hydratase/2-oxohepta-3-ene-1,7-dioic acid hydratase in catechol pathway
MDYKKLKMDDGTEVPVGTMYCIGQNYAKHAAEMGSSVSDSPTVFIKPPSAYIENGDDILLPDFSSNIHHEVELVVLIGKDCRQINEEDAWQYIAGYAVGIDVTLRDLQGQAKKEGKPWSVAKGFYTSAPISTFVSQINFGSEIPFFDLKLWVNGELKQSGTTKEMERTVANLLKYLAGVFTLRRGDLIFTGTPEGVGQIKSGDKIYAELSELTKLTVGAK